MEKPKDPINNPQDVYSYKLPDWCYEKDIILLDVQQDISRKEIIYTFKNVASNNYLYHVESSTFNYFYTIENNPEDSDLLCKVQDTKLRFDKKGLSKENICLYEADISQVLKHSIDYYYNRNKGVPEPLYKMDVMYWDIEIYNERSKEFPTPSKAEKPINAISFKISDGPVECYLLNHPNMDKTPICIENNKDIDFKLKYKLFDNEKDLISEFCARIASSGMFIIAGWNTHFFDCPYLFNRMQKLGIDPDIISPINRTSISTVDGDYNIYGAYLADQLLLYKKTVQNMEVNYKLSTISQKYLGKDKVAYEGTLDTLYETDINKFLEYSCTDTHLLYELEKSLGHIDLRFELIKLCSSTWKRAETTMGRAEPLLISYAKNKKFVCMNKYKTESSDLVGAYVLPTRPGMHKWVVDFDFKSLYPSIMCTLNLGTDTYQAKVSPDIAKTFLYNKLNLPDTIQVIKNPSKKSAKTIMVDKHTFINSMQRNNYIMSINGCIFKSHDSQISFLNEILVSLIKRRDEYKNEMKGIQDKINAAKTELEKDKLMAIRKKYDIIQNALKIQVNALFGAISNKHFRFYNMDLGEAITSTGQEVLKFCIYHLNKYMTTNSLEIDNDYLDRFNTCDRRYSITSDTDSLYIALGEYLLDKNLLSYSTFK